MKTTKAKGNQNELTKRLLKSKLDILKCAQDKLSYNYISNLDIKLNIPPSTSGDTCDHIWINADALGIDLIKFQEYLIAEVQDNIDNLTNTIKALK